MALNIETSSPNISKNLGVKALKSLDPVNVPIKHSQPSFASSLIQFGAAQRCDGSKCDLGFKIDTQA